jgi:hypothetical protein
LICTEREEQIWDFILVTLAQQKIAYLIFGKNNQKDLLRLKKGFLAFACDYAIRF